MVRVALFATCLGDRFFAEACADAVRLLRHLGADVHVPAGLTCCGQPAYNAGLPGEACRMAEHTIVALEGVEHVVLPSGSCAGMIRCFYPALLAARPRDVTGGSAEGEARERAEAYERARVLASRTYELSEFLVRVLGVDELGAGLAGRRVAYHHGCHALRELHVCEEPVRLLRGTGAEVVPWEAERECCGFGGLFSAKLPEVSAAMADRKLDTLPAVDFVTSADGGCLLQLSGRARKRGSDLRFEHLASVLWAGARGRA